MKHQDHFCCRITCQYWGKQGHYVDECHIKRRESKKLKEAEEERRKNAGKGKPKGEGQDSWGSQGKGKGNRGGERRSSAAPTGGRGATDPTPKGEQRDEKWTVASTPSAGGADSNDNGKKRKLNWHSKCLQAAGPGVKFPEEG